MWVASHSNSEMGPYINISDLNVKWSSGQPRIYDMYSVEYNHLVGIPPKATFPGFRVGGSSKEIEFVKSLTHIYSLPRVSLMGGCVAVVTACGVSSEALLQL